jgi:glycerol kinase
MAKLVGAIDQGTTSTRFMIFDEGGNEVAKHQLPHEQILPAPGWVEHDPVEIMQRTNAVIEAAMKESRIGPTDLASVGVTNQRETAVVWNPKTGQPWCNAIVWQDTRNDRQIADLEKSAGADLIRTRAGLPPSTYFSAGKLQWILENIQGVKEAVLRGEAIFGTIDTWVLWNLTGGTRGGIHATDVTNACRTMLMELNTLSWDEDLMGLFGVHSNLLPSIQPSSSFFGETVPSGPFGGTVAIHGVIGDQQAATVGQVCFAPGESKNTYGTGNFMLLNTGEDIVFSKSGLLTTVCYQMGTAGPSYALEGSVAVTGSAVQWLRDQLGMIRDSNEVEELANTVENSGDVYFVPAFSGLFAPYWRSDARGAIVGLSRFANRGHLARATLESICYQTRDVLEAMKGDSGIELEIIRVDGGATVNSTLMQLQADILGVPVVRPAVAETTSLGAAYCAGLSSGVWKSLDEVSRNWKADMHWDPEWSESRRADGYANWKKAVERTLNWIE